MLLALHQGLSDVVVEEGISVNQTALENCVPKHMKLKWKQALYRGV